MLNKLFKETSLDEVIHLLELLNPLINTIQSYGESRDLVVSTIKKILDKITKEEKLGFVPSLKKFIEGIEFEEY